MLFHVRTGKVSEISATENTYRLMTSQPSLQLGQLNSAPRIRTWISEVNSFALDY